MKCPACKKVTLRIQEREGIEIDFCPQCRGVWLDRDELDKIVERYSLTESGRRTDDMEEDYEDEAVRAMDRRVLLEAGNQPDQDARAREAERRRKSLWSDLFD
jgi:Zn-finger nucleic acid-binding protein